MKILNFNQSKLSERIRFLKIFVLLRKINLRIFKFRNYKIRH
ncbi:hypothetical protein LEP1GSC074_3764 [Leptospira noguchii str. Hook]|uniref:Uncharacterized protein n=2 Tax=Leptospira noguchii TaxID=28182 RepID=M6XZM0_9LEPT|nr:hypothetical protein LEP1GSC041_1373 [Leptospira noguchii str. 2006001870]EMI71657.1 hypothetical protein LEP1GSC072_2266 [Leptospira noguchii str. Bonito]EMO40192.1 hypothetical protein LEP1GSC186_4021 [Leptospira noguchii serovar Autumnalis str. ZUN142]EMO86890.1 hypothetical protein LEP1GSC024_4770 [Leptospira noguchii str. 2001034031]EMS85894.1 hypothetical protein LEP1GSC074_3764 [Leptospira noguchii str. Hook]EMS89247.1 hypothetical protein LEP1GSC073_1962 [Leptospira noguchii str. Ca